MIYLIGGARPNFMKIAAISRAFEINNIQYEIVHTGQHYDYNMDQIFFNELGLKKPKIHLNVKSASHGKQTAKIMHRFEKVCLKTRPDMVFTVGDVNSTMATALVAAKMHIPVSHQEAGMRSGDMKMPEEINRIVTDHISNLLFPISTEDKSNLIKEGIDENKIFLVGDVMIDNLLHYSKQIKKNDNDEKFVLVEIHRPVNVDNFENLNQIVQALHTLSKKIKIIFSVHPRTNKMITKFNLWQYLVPVLCRKPMGYFSFLKHLKNASAVITDSDGIQQETSVLDIPCISIRDTCNIRYTIDHGTNVLTKPFIEDIYQKTLIQLGSKRKYQNFKGELIRLNDGNASKRIALTLINYMK